MIALLFFFLRLLVSPLKSASRLEAENAALRHQLCVLQRKISGRVQSPIAIGCPSSSSIAGSRRSSTSIRRLRICRISVGIKKSSPVPGKLRKRDQKDMGYL